MVNVRLPEGKNEKHLFTSKEEAELFQAQHRYDKKTNPGRLTRPVMSDQLFCDVTREYLKRKQLRKTTATSDLFSLNAVILGLIGGKHIKDISKNDYWKIVDAYKERGCKNVSINRRMDIVLAVMGYAFKSGYIKSIIPWEKLKDDSDTIRPPSVEEATALWQNAPEHLKRAILIASFTGIRPGPVELFSLKWNQIDWGQQAIFVRSAQKGGLRERMVPLHSDLFKLLVSWKEQDGEGEFIIHWLGRPVAHVRRAWESAKKKAGIERRLRPYDLRHYFVSLALAAGGNLKAVSQLVGHSDPTTTLRRYQHVIDASKVDAINGLPSLGT